MTVVWQCGQRRSEDARGGPPGLTRRRCDSRPSGTAAAPAWRGLCGPLPTPARLHAPTAAHRGPSSGRLAPPAPPPYHYLFAVCHGSRGRHVGSDLSPPSAARHPSECHVTRAVFVLPAKGLLLGGLTIGDGRTPRRVNCGSTTPSSPDDTGQSLYTFTVNNTSPVPDHRTQSGQ